MPITERKLAQFGADEFRVLAYINLRRSLIATGGIQICVALVALVSAIILGFTIPGYVTLCALGVAGVISLAFGLLSSPIDAPYVVGRRIKRIKVVTSIYMVALFVVLGLALLTMGYEFWIMVTQHKNTDPLKHFPFGEAMVVVVCAMAVALTAVPFCGMLNNMRQFAKSTYDLEFLN